LLEVSLHAVQASMSRPCCSTKRSLDCCSIPEEEAASKMLALLVGHQDPRGHK